MIVGATALKGARLARRGVPPALATAFAAGVGAAFVSTLASVRLIRAVERDRSLAPYAAYRAVLAAVVLRALGRIARDERRLRRRRRRHRRRPTAPSTPLVGGPAHDRARPPARVGPAQRATTPPSCAWPRTSASRCRPTASARSSSSPSRPIASRRSGIDCVAMNVNDLVCVGAEPIALLDYLAVEQADPDALARDRHRAEGRRRRPPASRSPAASSPSCPS